MIECYPSHQPWGFMVDPRICHDIPRLVGGALHSNTNVVHITAPYQEVTLPCHIMYRLTCLIVVILSLVILFSTMKPLHTSPMTFPILMSYRSDLLNAHCSNFTSPKLPEKLYSLDLAHTAVSPKPGRPGLDWLLYCPVWKAAKLRKCSLFLTLYIH